MPTITAPSDYLGKFEISQNPRETQKLQGYIDLYENQYMMELLGVELYSMYVSGVAVPNPIYVKLRDPFAEDVKECGCDDKRVSISKGVKEMLLGFIYYQFYYDEFSKSSINGRSKPSPENSTNSSTFISGVYSRYNESISTYRAIQDYIKRNIDVYPTYNGVNKQMLNWF